MMKKLFSFGLIFLAFLLLFSLAQAESAGTVVMVYLTGSNLESQGGAGSDDLQEMMNALPEDSDIQVVVMPSGSLQWKRNDILPTESSVYEIRNHSLVKVLDQPAMNMGDPSTLSGFLSWTVSNYPAEQYALILWDHGGGPLLGVCFDERYGQNGMDSLSLPELQEALGNSPFRETPLLFIGFDACLMATYEAADAVNPYAQYMIASQELEPASGWDYVFLRSVSGRSSGEDWGRAIVGSYLLSLQGCSSPVTLSCLDLGKFPEVASLMDTFFSVAGTAISDASYPEFTQCRTQAKSIGSGTASGCDLIDLIDLLGLYQKNSLGDVLPLQIALQDMVVCQGGYHNDFTNGISIFYPFENKSRYISGWSDEYTSLNASEGYQSFIRAISEIYLGQSLLNWQDRYQTKIQEQGGSARISVDLTPEEMLYIARSRVLVQAHLQGDTYQFVYYSTAVDRTDTQLIAKYGGEALYIVDENGEILDGPLSYFPVDDGVLLYCILYFDADPDVPQDGCDLMTVAQLIFRPDEDGIYRLSEILTSDTTQGSEYLPSSIRLEDCRGLRIQCFGPAEGNDAVHSLDFVVLNLEAWVDHPDSNIQLAFLPVQDQNERFAYLRITDLQGNTFWTEPVSVPNPSLISVAAPQHFYSDGNVSVNLESASLVTGYNAGLKLEFTIQNRSSNTLSFTPPSLKIEGVEIKNTAWHPSGIEPGGEGILTVFVQGESIRNHLFSLVHTVSMECTLQNSQGEQVTVIGDIPVSVDLSFFNPTD